MWPKSRRIARATSPTSWANWHSLGITSIELPTKAQIVFAKGQFSLSNLEFGAKNKNTLTIDVGELQDIQPRNKYGSMMPGDDISTL